MLAQCRRAAGPCAAGQMQGVPPRVGDGGLCGVPGTAAGAPRAASVEASLRRCAGGAVGAPKRLRRRGGPQNKRRRHGQKAPPTVADAGVAVGSGAWAGGRGRRAQ